MKAGAQNSFLPPGAGYPSYATDANVISCKEALDSFIKKLSLWNEKLNAGNLEMFQEYVV